MTIENAPGREPPGRFVSVDPTAALKAAVADQRITA